MFQQDQRAGKVYKTKIGTKNMATSRKQQI
jgi:hypothetical protein